MNETYKSLKSLVKSFNDVIRTFAQSNRNFVVIIIFAIFYVIYQAANSDNSVIWVLATLNAFLCLINYAKTKNLTETLLTLMIGLFTIFTVSWTNTFILVFVISILVFTIFSFILSSVQIASKIESIITPAASYLQNGMEYKDKYRILYKEANSPTKNHQLGIVERALVVKELVLAKIPIEHFTSAKEIIEGFITVLGFDLDDSIEKYKLLNRIFLLQKDRCFNFNDIERLFSYILSSSLTPREYFEVLESVKKKLLEKAEVWERIVQDITNLSISIKDKDLIIEQLLRNR